MEPTVLYLSRGRLFLKAAGHAVREIESPFGRQVHERQARSQQVHGWKSRSGVWGAMGLAPPEWSQWEEAGDAARRAIRFLCVSRGAKPNEFYYVLDLGAATGLFRYQVDTGIETRLMHRNDFPVDSLTCHPSGELAVSIRRGDGTHGLAFSQDEGRHWNHVTGGDSIDQAATWVPEGRRVVFQSAALGRNNHGLPIGKAPYVIESLDLATGHASTTIREQTDKDLLLPRVGPDQALFFLRRPYQPPGQSALSIGAVLLDIVLFPFRFIRFLIVYFNFFSMMYSGKPLVTSLQQNPWRDSQKQRLMLWGHMVDTRKAMTDADDARQGHLVPKSWELMQLAPDGTEQLLARNVVAYDVASTGEVVYTNGSHVYWRQSSGKDKVLCDDSLIESVAVLA